MNIVSLIGRLTDQPQLRQTTTGKSYCRFSLAVNKKFSRDKQVDFIECVAWEKTADLIVKYIGKGNQMGVIGCIQVNTFKDKDGNNRKTVSVLVEQIEFIGGRTTREEDNFNPSSYDEAFKGDNKTPYDFNRAKNEAIARVDKQIEEEKANPFDIDESDILFKER